MLGLGSAIACPQSVILRPDVGTDVQVLSQSGNLGRCIGNFNYALPMRN